MTPSTLRFFFTVAGPRAGDLLAGLLLIAYAGYVVVTAPTEFNQVLGLAIVLQLFAASTGYRDRLRRGHFDPILAGRTNRLAVAATHWAVSSVLGLAVWCALVAIELATRPNPTLTSLAPGELSALLYVGTAAWMLTLSFPRYSGAILWLLALIVLLTTPYSQTLRVAFTPVPDTWTAAVRAVSSVFVIPFLLLIDPTVVNFKLMALTVAGAAMAWMLGAALIDRFDGALAEER